MAYEYRGMIIPDRMMERLQRYIKDGIPTGSFLNAILENDLRGACEHADDGNLLIIPAYVAYLYNNAPSVCWGSKHKVEQWLSKT